MIEVLSYLYVFVSMVYAIYKVHGESHDAFFILPRFLWLSLIGYLFFCVFQLGIFVAFGSTINKNYDAEDIHTIYRKVGLDTVKMLLDTLKVRIHVEGMDMVDEEIKNGKYLLVSNHLSCYDPLIYLMLFRKYNLAFVSKKENFDLPFVGRYMKAIGCVGLDREDNRSAIESINLAANYVKNQKANMGIFPEGASNFSKDVLLPFKSGAFKIAKKAEAPIVVATIRGTNRIKDRFWYTYTDVYVDIIGVIEEEKVKDLKTPQLSKEVYEMIEKELVGNNEVSDRANYRRVR